MRQKVRAGDAPSICAASKTFCGRD